MKKRWTILVALLFVRVGFAAELDLFLLAGQSNAQGWMGDAAQYPQDPQGIDGSIRFYWVTPGHSSSSNAWTTLRAQGGRFKAGHFGLEVSLARALKEAGYQPAVFKYSLGSTSLAANWKGPGQHGMYDRMVTELDRAVSLLRKEGQQVNFRGFVWIQGESDAATPELADAYKPRLKALLDDLRQNVTKNPDLAIILGVDEQHPWVKKNPRVVAAQQELAQENRGIMFTSMLGLPKADSTHLNPKGLEEHGRRIFAAYKEISGPSRPPARDAAPGASKP